MNKMTKLALGQLLSQILKLRKETSELLSSSKDLSGQMEWMQIGRLDALNEISKIIDEMLKE